jgi:Flp pilus assembly pilin Flp
MLRRLLANDDGQAITGYAVLLAVILIFVIGTVQLVGGNAKHAFSRVVAIMQPDND